MPTDRRIFPDGLAELNKSRAGEKYRPSNGTEGEYFREAYCHQCAKQEGCKISGETMWLNVSNQRYPRQWQYGPDGQPTCTAFLESEDD